MIQNELEIPWSEWIFFAVELDILGFQGVRGYMV